MNELELEREVRAALRRREADVKDPGAVPPARPVLRQTHRRQLATVLITAAVAIALVLVAVTGVTSLLRTAERRTPATPPSIAPAAACPPGSTPNEPGPVGQARPPYQSGPMAFDRDAHRIVLLGPSRFYGRIWTFDVCINTWTRMGPAPAYLGEDPALVYDPGSDRILVIRGGGGSDVPTPVWAYDPDSDSWSRRADAPTSIASPALVYDPVAGIFIVRGPDSSTMWSYDPRADTWREIEQRGTLPPGLSFDRPRCLAQFLSYDASADRLVLYLGYCGRPHRTATWEFDPRTHVWSEQPIRTPLMMYGYLPYPRLTYATYDEANERDLVFSWDKVISYDASAHRWSLVSGYESGASYLHQYGSVVFDPVNARSVLYGGYRRSDVWAFDLLTRSWIHLLAASERSGGKEA